jgi:hypothetical protein
MHSKRKTIQYRPRRHSFRAKLLHSNRLIQFWVTATNSSHKKLPNSSNRTTSYKPKIKIYSKRQLSSPRKMLICLRKTLSLRSSSKSIPSKNSMKSSSSYRQKSYSYKMLIRSCNPPSNQQSAITTSSNNKLQNNLHNLPNSSRTNKEKSNSYRKDSTKPKPNLTKSLLRKMPYKNVLKNSSVNQANLPLEGKMN